MDKLSVASKSFKNLQNGNSSNCTCSFFPAVWFKFVAKLLFKREVNSCAPIDQTDVCYSLLTASSNPSLCHLCIPYIFSNLDDAVDPQAQVDSEEEGEERPIQGDGQEEAHNKKQKVRRTKTYCVQVFFSSSRRI